MRPTPDFLLSACCLARLVTGQWLHREQPRADDPGPFVQRYPGPVCEECGQPAEPPGGSEGEG